MDNEQEARLARLASRGRVTVTPGPPAPAVSARADDPQPPTANVTNARGERIAEPNGDDDRARAERSPRRTPGAETVDHEPHPSRGASAGRGRRRHPAAAGRILAVGFTTSAFIGAIAALASAPPPAWESQSSAGTTVPTTSDSEPPSLAGAERDEPPLPPVQDTIYLVQIVPHAVYVDEDGNPVDPDASTADDEIGDDTDGAGSQPPSAAPPAAPATPDRAPAATAPSAPAPAAPTPAPTAAPRPTTPPTTKPACTGSKCA